MSVVSQPMISYQAQHDWQTYAWQKVSGYPEKL